MSVNSGFEVGTAAGEGVRAGSRVLSIFENPLNTRVLRAHREGPQRLADLQEQISWSAQSTLRAVLGGLCDVGALERETVRKIPYAVATSLTTAGTEILEVGEVLETWLARCPSGPIAIESEEAKVAVKALAGGWNSTLIRALSSGPSTLTELDGLIPDISYPALERRLQWMRSTRQIEAVESDARGTPYVVTDWLRRSIAPLSAAGRCEGRYMLAEAAPITAIEVEAAFLLSLPLAPLPPEDAGTCMLAVQVDPVREKGEGHGLAGTLVEVEQGKVASSIPTVSSAPPSWAVGTPEAWLDAVIDGVPEGLRIGGADPQLPVDLVNGIHFALFTDR